MSNKVRVAFLNTHPIQYFAPLYAYLNSTDDLAVSALYLSDYSVRGGHDHGFGQTVKWDIDLLTGYDAQFVGRARSRAEPIGFFSIVAPELFTVLRKGHFDVLVVHGHVPAAYVIGAAAAKIAGTRVFMRTETHLGLSRSRIKLALRRPVLRTLYRACDGVLAIGSANADFYRAMGVPEERIFLAPYAVDNERFTRQSRLSSSERAVVRAQLGVRDEHPIVLYAAKFQKRKHPDDVLRAAAALNREDVAFHVAMVGSGEMEASLRTLALDLRLANVSFHGFVNQSLLPKIYGACDVFVLPAEDEPWGLAINEAMCAGLPIVASASIGCVPDLVQSERNGFTFQTGNVDELAVALRRLTQHANVRQRMGEESRRIIARWSYAECATGLRSALEQVGVRHVTDADTPRGITEPR